jgi:hypothetical protein
VAIRPDDGAARVGRRGGGDRAGRVTPRSFRQGPLARYDYR